MNEPNTSLNPEEQIHVHSDDQPVQPKHILEGSLTLVLLVAVVIGIGLAIWKLNNNTPKTNSVKPFVAVNILQAKVDITSTGYFPQELNIGLNTEVTWINDTNHPQEVDSAPYPTGTDLKGLNSGIINPGASYSFVFDAKGSWSYQNNLSPLKNGMITVK